MADSSVAGIPFPADYDGDLHNNVFRKVEAKYAGTHSDAVKHFNWGLLGLIYRYSACAEHDDAFTVSYKAHGQPPHPERFQQEKHLFGFFVTGLSAFECFAYAVYWQGSWHDTAAFPLNKLRDITFPNTVAKYAKRFSGEPLTTAMEAVVASDKWKEWGEVRNVLAHRAHPGRTIYATMGGETEKKTDWIDGIVIDDDTTKTRRDWLSSQIKGLLQALDTFVDAH
jgi:hypothetical protein